MKEQIAVNSPAEVTEVRFKADKSVLFTSVNYYAFTVFM